MPPERPESLCLALLSVSLDLHELLGWFIALEKYDSQTRAR